MKNIRFCHLSDPHLGRRYNNETIFNDTFDGFKNGLVTCMDMEPEPDFILMTGDLFDRIDVRAGVLNKFYSICDEFFEVYHDIKIFLIPGNHDFPKTNYTLKRGYILQLLQYSKYHSNLILVDDEIKVWQDLEDEEKEVLIIGLRYRPSEPLYRLEELLRTDENKKILTQYKDLPKILMMHQYCSGMQLVQKSAIQFDENDLNEFNFDYIGIGHNHSPWDKPALNIYCPGSTEHISRSDWNYPQRYIYKVDLQFDNERSQYKAIAERIGYDVRKKIFDEIDLGITTIEDALDKVREKIMKITEPGTIVYLKVYGTLPSEETRLLNFHDLGYAAKNMNEAVSVTIENNVYTAAYNVDSNAQTAEEILKDILENKFKMSSKERLIFTSIVEKIRESDSKFKKDEEIGAIVEKHEDQLAKFMEEKQ